MIPDRLQYFLEDFWNDKKCDQIWTLGPRIYHQNTSKNTRQIWKHPWAIYSYLIIWNFDNLGSSAYQTFKLLEFENLKIWKFFTFENLNVWELKNMKFVNLKSCKCIIYKLEMCEIVMFCSCSFLLACFSY